MKFAVHIRVHIIPVNYVHFLQSCSESELMIQWARLAPENTEIRDDLHTSKLKNIQLYLYNILNIVKTLFI